jgi:hypothetical protein
MQIFWMDVSLIWVSPECHDTGSLAYLYHGTLGWEAYLSTIRRKRKLGMVVPYLICVVCVDLRHAAGSLGFLRRRDGNYALLSESWA